MDNTRIILRRPDIADWPCVMEILREVNYHHIGSSEMPAFPLEDCFVAEVDGKVVGVAGYRILDSENAKTTLMAVNPAYRELGIGRKLQRKRMDFLRTQGIKYLTTNCDDEKVIDWYCRHFGYRRTGERVPKTAEFGRADREEWITLICPL